MPWPWMRSARCSSWWQAWCSAIRERPKRGSPMGSRGGTGRAGDTPGPGGGHRPPPRREGMGGPLGPPRLPPRSPPPPLRGTALGRDQTPQRRDPRPRGSRLPPRGEGRPRGTPPRMAGSPGGSGHLPGTSSREGGGRRKRGPSGPPRLPGAADGGQKDGRTSLGTPRSPGWRRSRALRDPGGTLPRRCANA